MPFNPFSFGFGVRLPGTLGELEEKLFEDAAELQAQIRTNDESSDRQRAESADRQRQARENSDRNKRLKEAQTKLREAKQELHNAEKAGAPEARLKTLAAEVEARQREFEVAAAEPSATPQLADDTLRAQPQQRLDQLRDLQSKAANLERHLNMPQSHVMKAGETLSELAQKYNTSVDELAKLNNLRDPNNVFAGKAIKLPAEQAGSRAQLEGLLASYKQKINELNRATPADAARPTQQQHTPESPAGRLEQQAMKMREKIAQARIAGKSDLQIENMETQLDALLQGVRNAATKLPASITTPGPDGQPLTRGQSELEKREADIANLHKQIEEASKNPGLHLRVERLHAQLSALQNALKDFKARGGDAAMDAPVTTADAREEISRLQGALDELGTGYELLTDPRKMEEAARLRKRLDQIQGSLPQNALVRIEPGGYGAETLPTGEAQGANAAQFNNAAQVIQDPKIKALLAKYYGDNEDFGKFQVRDPNLPKAQLTQEMTHDLAEDIAAEFLTYLPTDNNLPPELKRKSDSLFQSATNELTAAWNKLTEENGGKAPDPQAVFERAKGSLERNFMRSEDGAYAVLRDLRGLMNRGRSEGSVSEKQYEKYEQFLNRTFTADLKDQIEHHNYSNKEDVVQDLFKSALQYADNQIAREQKNAGGSVLERLAGLSAPGGSVLEQLNSVTPVKLDFDGPAN